MEESTEKIGRRWKVYGVRDCPDKLIKTRVKEFLN